jgi:hypothetical protein
MKTPREILFARNQNAAPKLDAIRREVVAGLNHQGTKAQSVAITLVSWCLGGSNKLWLELIWPCRRIWTGLAAVWILIFIVNFSQHDKSEMMAKNTSPSPEMILAFRQQEKLLAELIGQNEPQAAGRPKTFLPRPSSERSFETLTV